MRNPIEVRGRLGVGWAESPLWWLASWNIEWKFNLLLTFCNLLGDTSLGEGRGILRGRKVYTHSTQCSRTGTHIQKTKYKNTYNAVLIINMKKTNKKMLTQKKKKCNQKNTHPTCNDFSWRTNKIYICFTTRKKGKKQTNTTSCNHTLMRLFDSALNLPIELSPALSSPSMH